MEELSTGKQVMNVCVDVVAIDGTVLQTIGNIRTLAKVGGSDNHVGPTMEKVKAYYKAWFGYQDATAPKRLTFDEEDDEFGGFELPKMPEPVFNLNAREEDDEFGNVLAMSDPNIQPTHTPPAVTKPAPAPITVAPPPASSFVFNMDEDF